MIFTDTSGLYATLDAADPAHDRAGPAFSRLLDEGSLVTHSYVILETTSLLQHRLGVQAAIDFLAAIVPLLDVVWVDRVLHTAAVNALMAAKVRRVSLVDWVSFEVMRSRGIAQAFAFDDDFRRHGFTTVP